MSSMNKSIEAKQHAHALKKTGVIGLHNAARMSGHPPTEYAGG